MALTDLSNLTLPELRALEVAVRAARAAAHVAGGGRRFLGGDPGRCRGRVGDLHHLSATPTRKDLRMTTKNDMAAHLAAGHGLTQANASKMIDTLMDFIGDQVMAGEKIVLHGFGTFAPRDRKARMGRNPRTGEAVEIAASTTIGFRASPKRVS